MLKKKYVAILTLLLVHLTLSLSAFQDPDATSPMMAKEVRHAGMEVEGVLSPASDLQAGSTAHQELADLSISPQHAFLDQRSGRWATLWLKEPLLPGSGAGNDLQWANLGYETSPDDAVLADLAWQRFLDFLEDHHDILRIDTAELDRNVAVHSGGSLIQIHASRALNGVPVQRSTVSATVNHGNLILLGAHLWGDTEIVTAPSVSQQIARQTLAQHLRPLTPKFDSAAELIIVPFEGVNNLVPPSPASPYDYRLVWRLRLQIDGDMGTWEGLVDAHSGALLQLIDNNEYARQVTGGVFPITNDGNTGPDSSSGGGVEIAGYPMPFADVSSDSGNAFTDSGGNVEGATGTMSTTLSGLYVDIIDQCGAIDESTPDNDLDLGTSDGTDCVTPIGSASPGNTHSARSGFFELNRIKETARAQLPGNSWLQQTLPATMNINQSCNAFWDGNSVNFYRQGGPCANTGEIAGVFHHEWGHGMDDNDLSGTVAVPSGAAADIYAALRLNTSCIGRGFVASNCNGYGDACTSCTGVRDIDWEKHASGVPHDVDWAQTTCGGTGSHCCGYIPAEAVWDLAKRDLPTFYGQDDNTALEITTRLMFIGSGNISSWYAGANGEAGCAATSGYMQFLATDDDDGDLSNGTPHMQALFAAFDRHGIACSTPTVQDGGCADRPIAAPVVAATPLDRGAALSWPAVADATRYKIYRTDGEFGCDFGKVLVGETSALNFTDSGLPNGRETYYIVAAFSAGESCMGPASSCVTTVASAGGLFLDGFESGDTTQWSGMSAFR